MVLKRSQRTVAKADEKYKPEIQPLLDNQVLLILYLDISALSQNCKHKII